MATGAYAIFTRYSDNVARDATITIQLGTDPNDSNYAPESLVDDNPAKVAKILSTTGAWEFDFGSAQRIDLVALIHHTFDAGANVKIEGSAAPNWGGSPATAAEFSASFTIPTWLGSGDSLWPVNPWLDLTNAAGYSAAGFRYWRLIVTGNSQNLWLGEIVMVPSIRQMNPDRQWEYVTSTLRRKIDNRTEFGVSTIYSRYSPQVRIEGTIRADDDFTVTLDEHWDDVDGGAFPWLYIPDGDVNKCYFGRHADPSKSVTHVMYDVHDRRWAFEEAARGLRPGV